MTDKPDGKRTLFVIEDELHSEQHGEFPSFIQAIDELRRRAAIPWNQEPNRTPCTSWKTMCGAEGYEKTEVRQCRRGSSRECVGSVRFRCQMVGRNRRDRLQQHNSPQHQTFWATLALFGQTRLLGQSPFRRYDGFASKVGEMTHLPHKSRVCPKSQAWTTFRIQSPFPRLQG